MPKYRLTEFSHGAGCGCKISPAILESIVRTENAQSEVFKELLVGNDLKDDAAVWDLGDGTAMISTTDFFMPIVDDAHTFGRIASVNAISDIYAMGGKPLMAIAILGWPIDKIPAAIAREVIEGAKKACSEIHIPLAGGHSIDSPEPIFGLAVSGRVDIENLKKNDGARVGDLLYLTKPIGVGILSTAQKKKCLRPQDAHLAIDSMVQMNSIGEELGQFAFVHAMTDVTGFGLAGHLIEICQASRVSAKLDMSGIPLLDESAVDYYLNLNCIPGGTKRNFESYGTKIGTDLKERERHILCDPQTSGGLLITVDPDAKDEVDTFLRNYGAPSIQIGRIVNKRSNFLYVN
jgi:selenide,water dikinase